MAILNESFADPSGSRGNDGFAGMARELRGAEKWYHINWHVLKEWKTLYVITACTSFFLLFLFGVVTIVPTRDCLIEVVGERCCDCLDYNESRVIGQTMPMETGLNSVFYGVVMMINSLFGFYYVIVGVKTENKYQLSCMIATQALEVVRALFDTWFEKNPALASRFIPRQVLAYGALVLLIASAALIPPLYKQFGWSIFRKGGVLKPVRERYKIYQMFRAFNRLDVQSSSLLFIIFCLYLEFIFGGGMWWIFVSIVICDTLASRYMVRYLKREDAAGFYLTLGAKAFVMIWWIGITYEYMTCRQRYKDSLNAAMPFWDMSPYPLFQSAKDTYNGVACLAAHTHHDDRTLEVIWLNLAQAIIFRVGSLIYGFRVARRFGGGLKTIFYRETVSQDDGTRPEGGQAIKFVPKKKKGGAVARKGKNSSTLDDQELQESSADSSPSGDYERYEETDSTDDNNNNNNNNKGRNDEDQGGPDAMEEDGVSRREMEDELGW